MSMASGAAASPFASDPWLAETLGQPVYRLTSSAGDARLYAEMCRLAEGDKAFFYAKIPTADVAASVALQSMGFAVVDTTITFTWREGGSVVQRGVEVAPVNSAQGETVAGIAETSFVWSRFHLDPKIAPAAANLVKRRWIENYVAGKRGSGLYAAKVNGEIAGFLAVLEATTNGRNVAVIDLIGVSSKHQQRGVGTALVQAFVRDWRTRASELRVGTQAANIRSLRFYESNGFRVADTGYVLHAHMRNGEVWQ